MKSWLSDIMKDKIAEQKICTEHNGEHHYIPLEKFNFECPICYMAKQNGDENYE